MHRKDRIFETLRSLSTQRPAQSSALRRHNGFTAEEVAEQAGVDRTNASRDLNLLAQEGVIERIPGRPVLFALKAPTKDIHAEKSNIGVVGHQVSQRESSTPQAMPPAQPVLSSQKSGKLSTISASVQMGVVANSFETLIGRNDVLKVAIQQAKAAILYPPRGLHTLLYGPSGVGKTTFARLMHAFALELQALPPNAPYISFNCADYAGNPQLLMAHLFGTVRGAYTGADRDRAGLVEQAHRGILFLDEVHRLPPEGQEMLFYLIDRERFRRLGDTKEREASLLLLAATTEDPTTALLPTFRRRIPMTITLPGLKERSITERYELLRAFFTAECTSIGVNIHVAPQVLRALLLYDCPGNIGQLRTDVQLTCARAYLEYRTNNLTELHIHTDVLPEHVRRGLLRTADLHRTLEPVLPLLETTHSFTPTGLSLDNTSGSTQNLYAIISTELTALRNSGLPEHEINKLLQMEIQYYFQHFADTVSAERSDAGSNLVSEHVSSIARSIIQFAEEQLQRTFPEKIALVLALHLASTLEHLAQGRELAAPVLESVRQTYPAEYEVAQIGLMRIRSALGVSLPESEANVLAVLFANADTLLSNDHATVSIIIAAHGRGIAGGLAELANTLVGINSISSVELTLDQSPEEILAQVEHCVYNTDRGSGILLFVDFPSLLSLEDLLTQRTGIPVRAIAGVSAQIVVEAVRRAKRLEHITLDQLAASLILFRTMEEPGKPHNRQEKSLASQDASSLEKSFRNSVTQVPRVILSVCLTGYGSAIKLAELLDERLPELRQQGIEVICMDISLSGKTEADVQNIVGHRDVVAVVGTINPHLQSYPFLSLTEFLFSDGITRLRTLLGSTLIDPALLHPPSLPTTTTPIFTQREDLFREISYTLSQRLLFLNPTRVLPLIERMIEMIEVEVGETFDIEVLAGLILHLATTLERGLQHKGFLVSETVRTRIKQQYARELEICRRAWHILSTQIARPLPEEEPYNIVSILRQVDIFLTL